MYNNKQYNKLTSQIRQDFNNKIQPYYIDDQCILCDSINNLELHHMIPLSQVVNDIYDLDYDNDIKRIFAIGKQIDNGFITVCHDCHKNHPEIIKQHTKYLPYPTYNYMKQRRENYELMLPLYIFEIRLLLEFYKGQKIFLEDQEIISWFLENRIYNSTSRIRGNRISIKKINEILKTDFDLDYMFTIPKQEGKGIKRGLRYTMIDKVPA